MSRIIILFFCFSMLLAARANADVITIQSVYFKNTEGAWVKIIEPDKQVDLEKEEPGLSFFNNGRVPDGSYTNFKLTLMEPGIREVSATQDFKKPLKVKQGSFMSVWFSLDKNNLKRIEGLELTVDEDTRKMGAEDVVSKS